MLAVIVDWPYQNIPWIYMASLWQSDVRMERDVMLVRTASPHSDAGFNASVQYALDKGAHEILSVSCDQSVPQDVLTRWRRLCREHQAQVVCGLTATRQPGHSWLIWDYAGDGKFEMVEPKEPVQRVAAAGGGCMFIKASVFRKIPRPWLTTTIGENGYDIIHTNEYNFFLKCQEHGIKVLVDNERVSDHQFEVYLNAQSLGRSLPRMEVYNTTDAQREHAKLADKPGYKPW